MELTTTAVNIRMMREIFVSQIKRITKDKWVSIEICQCFTPDIVKKSSYRKQYIFSYLLVTTIGNRVIKDKFPWKEIEYRNTFKHPVIKDHLDPSYLGPIDWCLYHDHIDEVDLDILENTIKEFLISIQEWFPYKETMEGEFQRFWKYFEGHLIKMIEEYEKIKDLNIFEIKKQINSEYQKKSIKYRGLALSEFRNKCRELRSEFKDPIFEYEVNKLSKEYKYITREYDEDGNIHEAHFVYDFTNDLDRIMLTWNLYNIGD